MVEVTAVASLVLLLLGQHEYVHEEVCEVPGNAERLLFDFKDTGDELLGFVC
jgi:hypothetical protein